MRTPTRRPRRRARFSLAASESRLAPLPQLRERPDGDPTTRLSTTSPVVSSGLLRSDGSTPRWLLAPSRHKGVDNSERAESPRKQQRSPRAGGRRELVNEYHPAKDDDPGEVRHTDDHHRNHQRGAAPDTAES